MCVDTSLNMLTILSNISAPSMRLKLELFYRLANILLDSFFFFLIKSLRQISCEAVLKVTIFSFYSQLGAREKVKLGEKL